ncbi:hypothetical protein QYF61_026687 [Mycteria americana]|uniref:Uncharacterized protein n=1 Tax=Mycteria americana TaxID=33587 RepID=A0AAN7NN47_MYCAM|nr:hypothetical protein QYF61_026687 [Mycteria americana]
MVKCPKELEAACRLPRVVAHTTPKPNPKFSAVPHTPTSGTGLGRIGCTRMQLRGSFAPH